MLRAESTSWITPRPDERYSVLLFSSSSLLSVITLGRNREGSSGALTRLLTLLPLSLPEMPWKVSLGVIR